MQYFRNNTGGLKRPQTEELSQIAGLVKRAADGDTESFGEIYSICLDRIYRYVIYQVRDKMAAEDITEETFFKAWKAIGSCKGKEHTFLPWLYRIAHNSAVDSLRSRNKQQSIEREILTDFADPALAVDPPQEKQEIMEVISSLPQNQMQVILLKFVDGLDYAEIGRIMSKSQGAVRVLQMRALASLRNILAVSEKQ